MDMFDIDVENFASRRATEEFINKEIEEKIWTTINYIEEKYKTKLIGERININQCKNDCIASELTEMQVSYIISRWREGILKRYSENKKNK